MSVFILSTNIFAFVFKDQIKGIEEVIGNYAQDMQVYTEYNETLTQRIEEKDIELVEFCEKNVQLSKLNM